MFKGLGFLLGLLVVIGGAVFVAMFIRKKLSGNEIDFDDFDTIDDEEFEHFFGTQASDTVIIEDEEPME